MMLSWRIRQWIGKMKEKMLVVKDKAILFTKNKYTWAAGFFILLFALGFYINSYTGRVVELQKKTEQQFSACEKNLTSCEKDVNATQLQLTVCKSDLTNTQSNLTTCTKENKDISFNLLTCQQNYSSLSSTYSSLKTDYEYLANKSATNICCKRKLDDPSLKYYYLDNNSIVCTATVSDRTKEFVCPSLT